jgi:hypothetical protein
MYRQPRSLQGIFEPGKVPKRISISMNESKNHWDCYTTAGSEGAVGSGEGAVATEGRGEHSRANDLLGRVVGNGFRPEHIAGARSRAASNAVYLKKVAVGIGLVAAGATLTFRRFRSMKRASYA